VFARQLGLPAVRGPRNDVAHFAHFENFDHREVPEGQVIISVLKSGWSWRIPLPGKLSVGIVMNQEAAAKLGATAEERLQTAIRTEPVLWEAGQGARIVSEAMTYRNYQLISERGHGPGWVTLGDAFGFVDPMLSPGLFMAMKSAELLDQHVFALGGEGSPRYEDEVRDWHRSWQELVDYFYDGRVLRMGEAGNRTLANAGPLHPGHLMGRHVDRVLGGMVSGVATRSRYNKRFLGFGTSKLTWGMPEAANFAVR
jgi:flavin-dependent dehydrogenase